MFCMLCNVGLSMCVYININEHENIEIGEKWKSILSRYMLNFNYNSAIIVVHELLVLQLSDYI